MKALLLKIEEGFPSCTQLRRYLVEHPLLVLELDFRPVLDLRKPYGFDIERTVPTARWFSAKQHTLEQPVLQALLVATVEALCEEISGLAILALSVLSESLSWISVNGMNGKIDISTNAAMETRIQLGE